jgi:hypothetical protein
VSTGSKLFASGDVGPDVSAKTAVGANVLVANTSNSVKAIALRALIPFIIDKGFEVNIGAINNQVSGNNIDVAGVVCLRGVI